MRSTPAALAVILAALAAPLLAGCASLAPADLVPVAERLDGLPGVEEASVTELDPAVRQIVVTIAADAVDEEVGEVVARFLALTEGAQESSLLVLPPDPYAAAPQARAAVAPALDVAPVPLRMSVSSLVADARFAAAAAAVWHRMASRLPAVSLDERNRGDEGDRFVFDVDVLPPDTVPGAADEAVRLLEASGIPAGMLAWRVSDDGWWSGRGVLPDEALRASVGEAVEAASPLGTVIASADFAEDLVTFVLEVGDPADPAERYAPALAAMTVLTERGVAFEAQVRSKGELLAVYGADGCPRPDTVAAGERPPALAAATC